MSDEASVSEDLNHPLRLDLHDKYQLRFANVFCGVLIAAPVLMAIVLLYAGEPKRLAGSLPFAVVGIVVTYFLRKAPLWLALRVLVYGVWACCVNALIWTHGLTGTTFGGLIIVLAFARWLAGPTAAILTTACTPVVLALLAYIESNGWPIEVGSTVTPYQRALVLSITALTAGALGYLWAASMRKRAEALVDSERGLAAKLFELQAREKELLASEARFRSLTELSSDWYWEQDADYRFIEASSHHENLGGLTSAAHYQLRRWELPGTEIIGQTWEAHRAVLDARQPFRDLTLRRIGAEGRIHYISVSGAPIFDEEGRFAGYRGVTSDITKRILAERRAQDSSDLLQLAIENLNESVVITDSSDRIAVANAYFRTLNHANGAISPGHTYEEFLRAGLAIGNYPEAIGRTDRWLAKRLECRREGGTIEIQHRNGTWLRVTDQHLPSGGIITFSLDITELKRAGLFLQEANAELEKRVGQRTAEIEAFMYSVSHDLRAPIRAIDGYSAMLQQELQLQVHDEPSELLARIRANSKRMALLLDDLLDLSRYSTQPLQKAHVDMLSKATSVVSELRAEVPTVCVDVGQIPGCAGDRVLLRQVWINLISNAIKYSSKSVKPLVQIGYADGEYFVADNGAGFDPAHTEKLFKLFSRLHHENEFEGTGIGLAVVKRIVERHGGTVRAAAQAGKGATFYFTIPA